MKLLKEVLREIKPNEGEIKAKARKVIGKINTALKKNSINAKATIGGSMAKGTFLKQDHDCDVFVAFDLSYGEKDISRILAGVLKKTFRNVQVLHGSRDYFQLRDSINYEIVPVLKIKKPEDAENVTDFSPLHVEWAKKFPKMSDEIRLTKAFCKAQGVYGAESYIKGFSGHVIDIITINAGGFIKLLRQSSKWKPGEVIDYRNYHKGKAMRNLNRSKTQSPLIVVDPIDPMRNASAALGNEKFEIFVRKAGDFIKNPSNDFFVIRKISLETLKKKAGRNRLVTIEVGVMKGKLDVIGAKVMKAFEFLKAELKRNDFSIIDSGWEWDKGEKAILWFILNSEELSKTVIKMGPPIKQNKHVKKFMQKHRKTFEKDNKIYSEDKRQFTKPEDLIKQRAKEEYIKEKVKSPKIKVYKK